MSVLRRLQQLEEQLGGKPETDVFKLEGGKVFRTECDPLSYLVQHGTQTPHGKIVGIARPAEKQDPITESVYEAIEQLIADPTR